MSVNELEEEVPPEVEAEAQRRRCAQGVTYAYRDGVYPPKGPVASIDCRKATRFKSKRYEAYKVDLGSGWVAFQSPSRVAAAEEIQPLADGEPPDLPLPRIGKITRRRKIDGSPLVFRVEEQELFTAPSNPMKAYLLQRLRMDDGQGFEQGHDEYRIAYYMVGHKERVRNRWAFGQFAPIMSPEDLATIIERMKTLGWLPSDGPDE